MEVSPPDQVRLLTQKQVADMLSVSERTIFSYVKAGKLRAIKLGHLVRFMPADVWSFVKSQEVPHGVTGL